MGSQLDIAGSFILAGMMLLSFNMFIVDKQQAELTSTNQVIRQEAMSSTTSLMMFDIRKAGYHCSGDKVLTADPDDLKFAGDIDNNGSVDTVQYAFKKTVITGGKNKMLLFRSVNGAATKGADLDILSLQFSYLDKNGASTTVPGDVKTIQASIRFKQRVTNTIDTVNVRKMDFRITPKNL